jgi:putative drug exporter of the RND superfamily
MDYEVFLLSRIREEFDRSGSTAGATVEALARTGRVVTCAALILAASFLSLGTNPNELVRIIATALAAGVLVDAVVVRTLLVPALVVLLGRWNWWMPSALGRLLRLPPGPRPDPLPSVHREIPRV